MMSQPPTWTLMAVPLLVLIAFPLLALLLGGLFSPRTRPLTLFVLVAIALVGIASVGWFSVSHSPVQQSAVIVPMEQWGNGPPETTGHWIDENTWHGGHPEYSSHTTYKHSYRLGGFSFVGLAVIVAIGIGIVSMIRKGGPALGAFGMVAAIFASAMGLYFFMDSSRETHTRGPVARDHFSAPMPQVFVTPPEPPQIPLAEQDMGAELVRMVTGEEPTGEPADAPQAEAPTDHKPAEEEESKEQPSPQAEAEALKALEAHEGVDAQELAEAIEPAAALGAEAKALKEMGAHEGVDAKELTEALDPAPAPAPAIDLVPARLPEWVQQPVKRVGEITRWVVSEGPHVSADEANRRVQPKIESEVQRYLREVASEQEGRPVAVPPLRELGITPRWVRENVVAAEHYASTDTSVADDMQTVYVLLEFTPRHTDAMVEKWQAQARRGRVSVVGVVASSVLATLGGVWGLLKVDTATKGYHTQRLFIGVPLAIIGGLALLGLMVS